MLDFHIEISKHGAFYIEIFSRESTVKREDKNLTGTSYTVTDSAYPTVVKGLNFEDWPAIKYGLRYK